MQNLIQLEGYKEGAIYSRLNENYLEVDFDSTFVLCLIPRLFTPHCANELKSADDILLEFRDAGITIAFASTDSPEVMEQYFGQYPVGFPFYRVNKRLDYDYGITDRFGDSARSTYFFKDGEAKEVLNHGFESERDFWRILQKAKEVLL